MGLPVGRLLVQKDCGTSCALSETGRRCEPALSPLGALESALDFPNLPEGVSRVGRRTRLRDGHQTALTEKTRLGLRSYKTGSETGHRVAIHAQIEKYDIKRAKAGHTDMHCAEQHFVITCGQFALHALELSVET